MIINDDQRGRTAGGRFTWRPRLELEADDFPPDSLYWLRRFRGARLALEGLIGQPGYLAWAEQTWPDNRRLAQLTWREIAETVEAAVRELNR